MDSTFILIFYNIYHVDIIFITYIQVKQNIYKGSIAFRHNLCLIIYSCITMWLVKINK